MFLITGANGQLGRCFHDVMELSYYCDLPELDITDEEAVMKYAEDKYFSAIINCAAYTAVDKAESEPELAHKINVVGAANLAKLANLKKVPLIHISTDYVFDTERAVPLSEDMPASPASVYGKTKFEGEEEIRKIAKSYIIIRTSWLYSKYGNNFLKTMINLAKEKMEIKVVADQYGTPTYAPDLVNVVLYMLERVRPDIKETYHFSNEGAASWYDFALTIIYRRGLQCKVLPIKTAEYLTKAKRPVFSVLDKSKIKKHFNFEIQHWTKGVDKCLQRLS